MFTEYLVCEAIDRAVVIGSSTPNNEPSQLQRSSMKALLLFTFLFAFSVGMQAQQWNLLGPIEPAIGTSTIGQVNTVAFNPTNPLRMYAGTPAGGVWTSSDGGQHWLNLNIDTLAIIGVSDIWINPADSNNIILTLGDRDENASYIPQGGALFQSTDGGVSWTRSGEVDTSGSIVPLTNFTGSRFLKNTATGAMFLASSVGLFSSTNFGLNWNTRMYKEKVWDLKSRPTDAVVLYAVIGGRIYRSLNSGTSFALATTGLPSVATSRIQLAVTAANQAVVYALYSNVDGTFGGLYKSSDYGSSWTLRSSSPNIFANSQGSGANGNNNLALAVSSTNENIVFAGGVNIWKSVDGGQTWSQSSDNVTNSNGLSIVSADIHELKFAPAPRTQILYASTGSGVFMSADTGRTWQNYSSGLQVAQMSGSAHHPTVDSLYLTAGPLGVLRYVKGTWTKCSSVPAIDVMYHPEQANVAYMATQSGKLFRSKDSGSTFTEDISPTNAPVGTGLHPYVFNPKNYSTCYAVLRDIWKTTNNGATWSRIINTFNATILDLAVSAKDTSMLYLITSDTSLYQSTNGGTDWKRISRTSLQVNGIPRGLTLHPKDASKLCVYGNKSISMSIDYGQSWIKLILTNNCYINSMLWKADNCGEDLIVGTNMGVRKLASEFQFGLDEAFGSQIPNTPVNDLKISGRWLRAATAGRGLYSAFVDDVGVIPDFSQDKTQVCPGEFVQFYDRSQFGGVLTKWTFDGGIPSTSTEEAPLVRFDSPGDHWVRLVAANGCGKDSIQRVCITVIPKLKANVVPVKNTVCVGDTLQINDQSSGSGGVRTWDVSGAAIVKQTSSAVFVKADSVGQISVSLTLSNSCGTNSQTKMVEVLEVPAKPKITVLKDTMWVPEGAGLSFQWYVNGLALTGATASKWIGLFSANYFVRVSNAGGCRVYSDTVAFEKTKDTTGGSGVREGFVSAPFSVEPNPTSADLRIRLDQAWMGLVAVRVVDMLGRVVYSASHECDASHYEFRVPAAGFAPGAYSVELRNGLIYNTAVVIRE